MKKIGAILMSLCILLSMSSCKNLGDIQMEVMGILQYYPTPDLLAFIEQEGTVLDTRFGDKNGDDKGSWAISSTHSYYKGDALFSWGMYLSINRNSKKIEGTYTRHSYHEDQKKNIDEEYMLTYDALGFHLLDEGGDASVIEEVKNFKFAFQAIDLQEKEVKSYRLIKKSHNPKIPSSTLTYRLSDKEKLSKLKKQFPFIKDTSEVDLILEDGEDIDFFINDKKQMHISERISFLPSKEFVEVPSYNRDEINGYFQKFDEFFPTLDFNSFFTKKAYANDDTNRTWSISSSLAKDKVEVDRSTVRIDKKTEIMDASLFEVPEIIPVRFEQGKFVSDTSKSVKKRINDMSFIIQKVSLNFSSFQNVEYNFDSEDGRYYEARININENDEFLHQLKSAYPQLNMGSEAQLVLQMGKQTNLEWGFGERVLHINFISTNNEEMNFTTSILYD